MSEAGGAASHGNHFIRGAVAIAVLEAAYLYVYIVVHYTHKGV